MQVASAFFGPWVVRSAFVLAVFGWGVGFYGPAIYLAEVVQRTGWSIGLVSSAVTVHFLFGAIVVASLPGAYARAGLPLVTVAGAVSTGLGVAGWALVSQPWQLFVAALFSGGGWVAMGAVAINSIVAPWYGRGRPAALGKAYNGASVGGVIFSPLWVALISGFGFPVAAGIVGVVMVLVVLVLAMRVFSKSPEGLGQSPDGAPALSPGEAQPLQSMRDELPGRLLWRDRAFVTLAAGMAVGLFAQIGLLAHLFNILAPVLGAQRAGFLMGAATACAILGRSAAARVIARTGNRRVVAAVGYAIQASGVALLLVSGGSHAGLIVVGVLLFGSGIGNATSMPPLIAQVEFSSRDVARVIALIVAMGQAAYAFAPAGFGFVLGMASPPGPQTATHAAFYLAAISAQLLAAAIFLWGGRRTAERA